MDRVNSLSILSWNANGLQNKIFILYNFMRDNQIHVACISETHFALDDTQHRDGDYIMYRLAEKPKTTDDLVALRLFYIDQFVTLSYHEHEPNYSKP